MKKFTEIETIELELSSITCDKCRKNYTDILELEEFTSISRTVGYASVFGDGNTIDLDICQHCLKETFGKYMIITESEC